MYRYLTNSMYSITLSAPAEVYRGRENTITYQKKGTLTARCNLNLVYYPFDTQLCTFFFSLYAITPTQGTLRKVILGYVVHTLACEPYDMYSIL